MIAAVRDDVVRMLTCSKAAGVLVAGADGKLAERKVKTGLANWEYTEVAEGLAGENASTCAERAGVSVGVTRLRKARARSTNSYLIELSAIACCSTWRQRGPCTAPFELSIDSGEYVAVMGPSDRVPTLLNLLGLLDHLNGGTYRLEGRDVTTLSPEEQARVRSANESVSAQSSPSGAAFSPPKTSRCR